MRVTSFGCADEFLTSSEIERTGCLILDVRMPGMNGLDLQRRLADSHPQLPVIFITAHGSDDEVRARALARGAVGYLLKPLEEEALLAAVQSALGVK